LLHWSGHEDVTLAEHAGIVDAIEARDAASALQRMAAHLDRSRALYAQPR
jgi:DNA-binding GntR family transcriptional regulator